MDNAIILHLNEEFIDDIKILRSDTVYDFIREELAYEFPDLSDIGLDEEALAGELLQLVHRIGPTSINAWVFTNDRGGAYRRALNKCLFTRFERSRDFGRLCERFAMEREELLHEVSRETLYRWIRHWEVSYFPNLAILMRKSTTRGKYEWSRAIEFRAFAMYLPKFILWDIKTYLNQGLGRLMIRELAMGRNIRTISEFPVRFTKRMAHYFTNAPKEFKFHEAIWYGIVYGTDGNRQLFRVLSNSFGDWYHDLDFLTNVIRFFTRFNFVDDYDLRRILGYLRHRRAEEPGFSLKGFTPASLRRRTDQWYAGLRQTQAFRGANEGLPAKWIGAAYRSFEALEEGVRYEIVQLTSVRELQEEGRILQHCVGTYAGRCVNQGTSIWSLQQILDDGRSKKLVTIEVSRSGRIIQAKGKMNTAPGTLQLELIRRWVKQEGLEDRLPVIQR